MWYHYNPLYAVNSDMSSDSCFVGNTCYCTVCYQSKPIIILSLFQLQYSVATTDMFLFDWLASVLNVLGKYSMITNYRQ